MNTEVDKARLPTLVVEIGEEMRSVEEALKSAVVHAVRAGEKLLEAKELVEFGGWIPWLDEYFPGSKRTAQNYMKLAKNAQHALLAPTIQDALRGIAEASGQKQLASGDTNEANGAVYEIGASLNEINDCFVNLFQLMGLPVTVPEPTQAEIDEMAERIRKEGKDPIEEVIDESRKLLARIEKWVATRRRDIRRAQAKQARINRRKQLKPKTS